MVGLWDRSRIFATNCSITSGYYHAILRCFLPATTSVMVRTDSKPILRTITLPSRKKMHNSSLITFFHHFKHGKIHPTDAQKICHCSGHPLDSQLHRAVATRAAEIPRRKWERNTHTHTHMGVSIHGASPKWMVF